jgi:hypothetical protein
MAGRFGSGVLHEGGGVLPPIHQVQADPQVAVHQLVHLEVLVVVPEGIVEGLRHLQPSEVEQELQAADMDKTKFKKRKVYPVYKIILHKREGT